MHEYSFVISQIIGVFTTILGIISVQFTDTRHMLLAEILSNGMVALTYILLGGQSGFWVCLFATVHAVINIFYQTKGKRPSWWIFGVFSIIYAVCSLLTWQGMLDLLPFIGALCFALAIQQVRPEFFRVFMLCNSSVWIVYDIFTGAYTTILCHGLIFISTILAMIRLKDFRKEARRMS